MKKMNRRTVLSNSVAALAVTGLGTKLAYAASTTPKEHTVLIDAFKFVPETLEVRVGDKITWVNKDLAPHTATADEDDWSTEALSKDQSETLTVTEGMTESYYCIYHTHMKASIKITS